MGVGIDKHTKNHEPKEKRGKEKISRLTTPGFYVISLPHQSFSFRNRIEPDSPGCRKRPFCLPSLANSFSKQAALWERGMSQPILFRFDGIIKDRLKRICSAFESAIRLHHYRNLYRPAYPIKVNQQKQIIDVIRKAGKEHHLALEVGSKPELLAVLSVHNR